MKGSSLLSDKSNSICLVAILKDEEKFLDEWLIYHQLIGVDHFFLYDDNQTLPLKDFLTPHSGYVTVINWRESNAGYIREKSQIRAYNDACKKHIKGYEWVVFLDADEFVVLKEHVSLSEFLKGFNDASSVSLNWHLFGHNGFYEDPERLITTSINRRRLNPSLEVKTITRVEAIDSIVSAHFCNLKSGFRVDANNKIFLEELYAGKTDVAHINHYYCRSFNRWMKRVERGDVNYNPTNGGILEQRWRYNKDSCFKQFVTDVCRDKNEYVDNFMFKYRYDIQAKRIDINRDRYLASENPLTVSYKAKITGLLCQVEQLVISNHQSFNGIGYRNGKTGAAIFLFLYSKFVDDLSPKRIADSIIEDIIEEVCENPKEHTLDDLAGFGFGIEYLVNKGFIQTDTNENLEELDILLQYSLISLYIEDENSIYSFVCVGRYYLSRLKNPFNDYYHDREIQNRKILNQIVEILVVQVSSPSLTLVNFIIEAYSICDDKAAILDYLSIFISKIEFSNNIKFSTNSEDINFIQFAASLLKLADVLDNKDYKNQALSILEQLLRHLSSNKVDIVIQDLLLFVCLLKKFHYRLFVDNETTLLNMVIDKIEVSLNVFRPETFMKDSSVLNELLEIGLGFLSIIDHYDLDY